MFGRKEYYKEKIAECEVCTQLNVEWGKFVLSFTWLEGSNDSVLLLEKVSIERL